MLFMWKDSGVVMAELFTDGPMGKQPCAGGAHGSCSVLRSQCSKFFCLWYFLRSCIQQNLFSSKVSEPSDQARPLGFKASVTSWTHDFDLVPSLHLMKKDQLCDKSKTGKTTGLYFTSNSLLMLCRNTKLKWTVSLRHDWSSQLIKSLICLNKLKDVIFRLLFLNDL